ncbi:MAG: hypothetical protein ACREYE_06110 [Gammaproteobacteria bacterium]
MSEVALPCPRRRRGGLHFGPADGENGNGIFNLRDRQGVVARGVRATGRPWETFQ